MMKKIIAGVLIVLLSFNSFAAIVSDNDGSAFVTKAEFESLKKDFADQIDNYNTNIDNKIDGAIAAYLAGIQLQKEENMDNIYELLGGSKIKFGKPSMAPTINPKTGHALFFENSDRFGVNVVDRQRAAIMGDDTSRFWNSTGGGTKGQFIKYTATGCNYSQLVPGFYYRTQYKATLYGGVHLCKTTRNGKVKIEKLTFNRYSDNTIESSGDVYVSISDVEFSNQDDFMGNVKLTFNSLSNETEEYKSSDGKKFKYKVPSRKEMSIEFDCKANKTYYIKCQYNRTVSKNSKLYVTISNGAEITATWD